MMTNSKRTTLKSAIKQTPDRSKNSIFYSFTDGEDAISAVEDLRGQGWSAGARTMLDGRTHQVWAYRQ